MKVEGWKQWWKLIDEGRMLKDEWLRLKGVLRTDKWKDICDCRVAFATGKHYVQRNKVSPLET